MKCKIYRFSDLKQDKRPLKLYSSRTLIDLYCDQCNGVYQVTKNQLQARLKRQNKSFCSRKCSSDASKNDDTFFITKCSECGKEVLKAICETKKTKNSFCNRSCAAIHRNAHKTKGYRRSKLEMHLENKLPDMFPNLEFQFNNIDIINRELDIYLPEYKLAFEINGIFHYEPIFGDDKLRQIKLNDCYKIDKCEELGIVLYHIDIRDLKHFTVKNSEPYVNDIANKIREHVGHIPNDVSYYHNEFSYSNKLFKDSDVIPKDYVKGYVSDWDQYFINKINETAKDILNTLKILNTDKTDYMMLSTQYFNEFIYGNFNSIREFAITKKTSRENITQKWKKYLPEKYSVIKQIGKKLSSYHALYLLEHNS